MTRSSGDRPETEEPSSLSQGASGSPRLYLRVRLRSGGSYVCTEEQSHHLAHVLRLKSQALLEVFDGESGVFFAHITEVGKRTVTLTIGDPCAPFKPARDVTLFFAPIKRGPLEWLVQKATELGVRRLVPVMTQHTIGGRTNLERLQTIAIEAAEQSERHDVPEVATPIALSDLLANWSRHGPTTISAYHHPLYACLEREETRSLPLATALATNAASESAAFLIGPEGGFSKAEKQILSQTPFVQPVSLGPQILRAETAGLAALAIWQGHIGHRTDCKKAG